MGIIRISASSLTSTLTAEELRELEEAEARPIVFDEDSPEMTAEMLAGFKRMHRRTGEERTPSPRGDESF